MPSVVAGLNMAEIKANLANLRAAWSGETFIMSTHPVEPSGWPAAVVALRYLRGHYNRKRRGKSAPGGAGAMSGASGGTGSAAEPPDVPCDAEMV